MRIQYSFHGRVQGVGFRATARSIAQRFPVTGWVRNESDNSVTLHIQGSPDAIASYITALTTAMGRNISRSTETPLPEEPNETDFTIHR